MLQAVAHEGRKMNEWLPSPLAPLPKTLFSEPKDGSMTIDVPAVIAPAGLSPLTPDLEELHRRPMDTWRSGPSTRGATLMGS